MDDVPLGIQRHAQRELRCSQTQSFVNCCTDGQYMLLLGTAHATHICSRPVRWLSAWPIAGSLSHPGSSMMVTPAGTPSATRASNIEASKNIGFTLTCMRNKSIFHVAW